MRRLFIGLFIGFFAVFTGCSTEQDIAAVQLAPGMSFAQLETEEKIELLELIGSAPEGALTVQDGEVLRWGIKLDVPEVEFMCDDDEFDESLARQSSGFSAQKPLQQAATKTCSNSHTATSCQSDWGYKYCECNCSDCGTVYTACEKGKTNCSAKCKTLTCTKKPALQRK